MAIVSINGQSAKAQVLIPGLARQISGKSSATPNQHVVPAGQAWEVRAVYASVVVTKKTGTRQFALRITDAQGNVFYELPSQIQINELVTSASKIAFILNPSYIAAEGSIVSVVDMAAIDPKDQVTANISIVVNPIPER